MRGKGQTDMLAEDWYRITPAYAGKSCPVPAGLLPDQDHPRLCGEKLSVPSAMLDKIGSPPPMRGKADELYDANSGTRITPAYAGKSTTSFIFFRRPQDHPRLCGEKPCGGLAARCR